MSIKYGDPRRKAPAFNPKALLYKLQEAQSSSVPFTLAYEDLLKPDSLSRAFMKGRDDLRHQHIRNNTKKSKIIVTKHAWERFTQRVTYNNCPCTTAQVQEIAYKARYNGINMNIATVKDFNGDKELFNDCLSHQKLGTELYYYNNFLFVFGGRKGRALYTVFMPKVLEDKLKMQQTAV